MKKRILLTVAVVLLAATPATWAQEPQSVEDLVMHVVEACETDLESYCSQVTPGEGRLLACAYAHGDKLSGRCEYALWQGAVALEQFVAAVAYVAAECNDDLQQFCSDVEIGEGRVGLCLLDHKDEVSAACSTAMDDAELAAIEE